MFCTVGVRGISLKKFSGPGTAYLSGGIKYRENNFKNFQKFN